MEILSVEHLSKKYGQKDNCFFALDDINFKVRKGEFVVIVGKSGSGKSTLLHLLGGLDSPTSGAVYINNKNIYDLTDHELTVFRRKNVGIIYQFYNLIPSLTVKENILLPSLFDKRMVSNQRLRDLLKKLGIMNKINNFPNDLSGGEQQRTAIGRALINNPRIMLADEPTGNLDSRKSLQIMKLLQYYNKRYKQTIIMVTHDDSLAKRASRVITMKDGKIIRDEINVKSNNSVFN